MRTFFTYFILSVFSLTLVSSCGSVGEATQQGEKFYDLIQNKKFDEVIDMLDKIAMETTPEQQWLNGLENIYSQRGKIESYTKTGFNTSIENDLNLIKLEYSVTYTNGVFKEQIEFIKRDNEYKIVSYKFN